MENLQTVGAAEAAGAVAINGNRKRSAASTNNGIYRSVVDFDSEEELRRAMMIPQGGGIGGGTSTLTEEMAAMIAAIADGQPVQKVC
jgi:hypothetical protein